jgi:Arc/MetJ-type ribon-helix-helix transcriptional regulator
MAGDSTLLKLITVKLPEIYLTGIDELVSAGIYPNRSEAMRVAIRDMLKRELWVKGKPKGA